MKSTTPTASPVRAVVAIAALAMVVAGCAGDGTDSTTTSPSAAQASASATAAGASMSTPPASASPAPSEPLAASSPTASGPLTREAFIEQGNAICAAGSDEVESADRTLAASSTEFFLDTVLPNIRQQVADMRALGFPPGDEETLEAIFDDTEAVLQEIEADPASVGRPPNPFEDLNERMADYGLTTCAEG